MLVKPLGKILCHLFQGPVRSKCVQASEFLKGFGYVWLLSPGLGVELVKT